MKRFELDGDCTSILEYANYGKINGLLLGYQHRLPVSKRGWIASSVDDDVFSDLDNSYEHRLICRADVPQGEGNKLPRGRDLKPNEIPKFLEEVQKICHDAIILVIEHPSLVLVGEYLPRYKVDGGAMAVIHRNNTIIIEYVGPGFDVGELTRGKEIHGSIMIPWDDRFEKPSQIYRWNKCGVSGTNYHISDKDYQQSRDRRISELETSLGEKSDKIADSIPKQTPRLSVPIYRKIYETCVQNIMDSKDHRLKSIFGVMINIYNGRLYVFEIWCPSRSSPSP